MLNTPFLFYPFFKISSFSYRIFEYKTFRGGFLLSHNAVNESCYVAQFVNSFVILYVYLRGEMRKLNIFLKCYKLEGYVSISTVGIASRNIV
jgi:hypothetical protein